jgi:hypothetical protein
MRRDLTIVRYAESFAAERLMIRYEGDGFGMQDFLSR